MSEASKNARRANIAKAKRLTSGSGPGKVDASSWTPPAPMKADKKTGMRPVSPRTYKHGGKVQGDRGPKRSDKAPRGNVADEISTRDTKQANRDKFGSPHIGGMKKGGKACNGGRMADGGRTGRASQAVLKAAKKYGDDSSQVVDARKVFNDAADSKAASRRMSLDGAASKSAMDKGAYRPDTEKKRGGSVAGGERPEGGRIPRKDGGSTYGSMDDKPRLRLVKTHTDGNKTAKVYKDADWGEYRVKHYVDGAHQAKADYHTDDASDATDTAKAFLRAQRASGGRTKGKTNINIIVNPNKPDQNTMPPSGPVRPPVMPPPPPPAPPMAPPPGAPPPNMPPPSMMAGAGGPPPPMRARGGRLGMNKIGGAGGGLGRLEKANLR